MTQDELKEVTSFLDLCTQHEFLRGNLMDHYSPQRLKADLAEGIKDYFRTIHYINDLKEAATGRLPVKSRKSPHRRPMIKLLTQLLHDRCEDTQDNAGLDLCFVTTNYDYCVESWIQESDEEFSLEELYRGFTPSHINGEENNQYLMAVPYGLRLFKLNGGFEITESPSGFAIDYRLHKPSSVMMLPSSHQDYGTEYFQCVLGKAAAAFREADLLLFVGYSFPPEDVLIRRLTALFGDSQRPGRKKQLIAICRSGSQQLKYRLTQIFGEGGPSTPELTVRSLDFETFCNDGNYYYEKLHR